MSSPAFPDLIIPGISSGVKYCIFRVNRVFDGVFEGPTTVTPYPCGTGTTTKKTRTFVSTVTWRLTASSGCDESASILPSSQLTAKGSTILREDGFAHFIGNFKIVTKEPNKPDMTYFQGTLEVISLR